MKNFGYYTVKITSIVITICLLVICLFFGSMYFSSLVKLDVPTLGPFKMYKVISDSMAPVFRVDDAVIVNAKSDIAKLNPGDIITFTAFESEAVITHRITNKEITATGYEFRTKGDNNNVEDSFVTSQSRIIGKYVTRIPQIAVWLEGALAKPYIVALLVAAVLLIQFMLGTLEKKLNPVKEVIAAETQAEAQTETGGEGPQLVAEGQVAAEPVAGLQVAAEEQGTTEQPQQQTDALRQFQGIAESWNNGDGSASDEKNKS